MKKLFLLALPLILFSACVPAIQPTPTPAPIPIPTPNPIPIPIPSPGPQVYNISAQNCPVVRVMRDNGEWSGAWGGVDGLRVPENGFSIQAERKQIQCRVNGVFVPF